MKPIEVLQGFWTWYVGQSNVVNFIVPLAIGFAIGALLL